MRPEGDGVSAAPPAPTFLLDVYARLHAAYGPQGWWPARTAWEVVVGAILTQHTSWTNVERALAQLEPVGGLTPQGLRTLPPATLAALIAPAGSRARKARTLQEFVAWLDTTYEGDLARLRTVPLAALRPQLLARFGIGPETADCILVYVAGRASFVIDAYTIRLLTRLGVCAPTVPYHDLQARFHAALPPDAALFGEYHALIVAHGKVTCRTRAPRCPACVLRPICAFGRAYPGPRPGAPAARAT
jgi:endonuclease-3 related protein